MAKRCAAALGAVLELGATAAHRQTSIAIYTSSSRTLWRQAGALANAGVADERVRGLLIKHRRSLKTVALLERRKRPPRLWAHHAIERAIVEPYHMKLYLRPPDVVFREIRGIYPMVRSFSHRERVF